MKNKRKNGLRWWQWAGLLIAAAVLFSIAVFGPPPGAGDGTRDSDKADGPFTATIEALIDGPKVCFARITVDGVPEYVNLGPYPACQEHSVGQEILVDPDDLDKVTTP